MTVHRKQSMKREDQQDVTIAGCDHYEGFCSTVVEQKPSS